VDRSHRFLSDGHERMPPADPGNPLPGTAPSLSEFATTHWSLVLAAGKGASADAQDALAALCQTYWYPLYAYVRRNGHQPDDAQDLTQEFFARLLEKRYLQGADPEGADFAPSS
jgi:RNA polymerase sigma-70 factor (ECF subfamily)